MSNSSKNSDGAKLVFFAAAFFTLAFLLFVGWLMAGKTCENELLFLRVCDTRWNVFLSAPPNEVGDALAGFAGGLALIWVVASVVIQRLELSSTVKELKAATKIETQREADRHIDALVLALRVAVDEDYSNASGVVWIFEPLPEGKFGAQGELRIQLPSLESNPASSDFLEVAGEKIANLRYKLEVLSEECKLTSAPSGRYYRFQKSSVEYLKIRRAALSASKAKLQELRSNNVISIGDTIDELNNGSWWIDT